MKGNRPPIFLNQKIWATTLTIQWSSLARLSERAAMARPSGQSPESVTDKSVVLMDCGASQIITGSFWITEQPWYDREANQNRDSRWKGERDFNSRVHKRVLRSKQNRRSVYIDRPISVRERTTPRSTRGKICQPGKYSSHLGRNPRHMWSLSTRQS